MKYMLLMYGTEAKWTEAEERECMIKSAAICAELAAKGKLLDASPLQDVEAATCVRIRNGRREITDGPFAETVEQLGGYYLLDVENLDEAIAIASRLPPAHKGTVEIRPLFPLPEPEVFARDLNIAASALAVYQALTTQVGIAGWWTAACTVSEAEGGKLTVRFGQTYKAFRIEQLVPDALVRWRCVEAHLEVPGQSLRPDEWVGTVIEFTMEPDGAGGTNVSLRHVGLGPHLGCYEICTNGWGQFLGSLKQFCESGVGMPYSGRC